MPHRSSSNRAIRPFVSLPAPFKRFGVDRNYAYGIGLHAVVDAANLDTEVIERTITRFRAVGENSWVAESSTD